MNRAEMKPVIMDFLAARESKLDTAEIIISRARRFRELAVICETEARGIKKECYTNSQIAKIIGCSVYYVNELSAVRRQSK